MLLCFIVVKDTKYFISKYDLNELQISRVRRPPKRYSGTGDQCSIICRRTLQGRIDTATTRLRERFNRQSSGLQTYIKLESMLLSADVDTSLCGLYPELCEPNLSMQLRMFRSQNSYVNINAAQKVLQSMHPEVRKLYPQVEQLTRLLLICSVTSCTSERSFSCLRRLKTWLRRRTTMSQSRLQHPSTPGGQYLC